MGWEAIHFYQFSLRAIHYGSSELSVSSPDVTLAALRLRKGNRFLYEYDGRLARQINMIYPAGGSGACPPEDCHNPAGFMDGSVHGWSWEAIEDLGTMAEIIGPIVLERRPEILDDEETRWRLESALDRTRARERAKGKPFSLRDVAARLRKGEHP